MTDSSSHQFQTRNKVETMPSNSLEWATFYISKGWSVLPIWWIADGRCACGDTTCRSPGKHPIGHMVPNGLKSASNEIETINSWANAAPTMNIAIATGAASNLVVLDLDIREIGDDIVDGEYELKMWLASRGIDFPESLVQQTGGGGSHIILDFPSHTGPRPLISSRTNWLPGVDIRADGGYIVAAPSQHISGKFYHWRDGTALSVVSNDLLNILANERRQTNGTPLPAATHSLDVPSLMRDGFRMGERDDGFTRLAGILRGRGDSIDSAYAITKAVWEKTDQNESDYFPLAIAYEKIERGYKRWDAPEELSEAEITWALRSDARATLRAEASTVSASLLTKPSKKTTEHTVTQTQVTKKASESPFISIDIEETIDDDEVDRDPADALDVAGLMDGGELERELPTMLKRGDGKCLIYPGRLHSIYGEPGHGKTWVSLHLVRERLEQHETVAYLDYDEDDGGKSMALRLRSLGVDSGLVRDFLRYLNPQGMGSNQLAWIKLKEQIREWKPTVVIVDTMAPALVELGLNEKDNSEVGAWYAHARWLLRGLKPQAALVIIDHVVKSGEGRGRWARGAGDKLGRLHAAYGVESTVPFSRTNPGHIRLVIAKDRGGEVGREGESAAVVKFNPSNNGQKLEILIDTPESADLSSLVQQHENRKGVVKDRLIVALRNAGIDGLTFSELKRAAKTTGPEGIEVINESIDDGTFAQDDSKRVIRYTLAQK